MKKILLLFFLSLSLQCTNERSTNAIQSENDKIIPSTSPDQLIHDWVTLLNTDRSQLNELYLAKALLLNEKGEIQNDLKSHLSTLGTSKISNSNQIKKIKATDNISYEIVAYETTEKAVFKSLVVWNFKEGKELKEVELLVKADQNSLDQNGIEKARQKWMQLCNAHDAMKLIKEMYTTQAVYYNHKPAVIGTKAISEVYTYMNDPNYKLSLSPIITESVNENIAFEIGQCTGSYGGKYVIIWQKDENGEWKVLMDTNV